MPNLRGRILVMFVVTLLACGITGCVERRYTIRTDPPGALVIANGEPIGTTPVSKSFTFYGSRSFRVIKEGYETKDVIEKFSAPWYDNYLTEFFTENLNPYTFRDEVEFNYKLEPARPADKGDLLNRAEATRINGSGLPVQRSTGWRAFFGL